MRAHRFRVSGSIVAVLLGLPSAHAQDRSGGTVSGQLGGGVQVQTTGTPPPGGVGVPAPRGEIGVQARPALTAQEQIAEADAIVRRAGQLAERLSKMLDEARREKDIMRANCVNRKLTEVNANTRNVEQRARALRDAASVGDDSRRSHEYTVLTVLSQKLNALDQEATQCLGQSVYEPGASQVVTTIPTGSPTIDPTVIDPSTAAPPAITVPPPNIPGEVSPTT